MVRDLGPKAQQYTPQQLAAAAHRIGVGQSLRREPTQSLPPSTPEPSLGDTIMGGIKLAARAIAGTITDGANALRFGFAHAPVHGDIVAPEDAQRQTQQTLRDLTALPQEMQQSIQRGGALLLSTAAAPVLGEALPIISGITGKVAQFLVGETLGGAVYGGVRPLERGESRGSAIAGDAAIFGLAGGGMVGAGAALRTSFRTLVQLATPHAAVPVVADAAVASAAQASRDIATAPLETAIAGLRTNLEARGLPAAVVEAQLGKARSSPEFVKLASEEAVASSPTAAEALAAKRGERITQVAPHGYEVTGTRVTPTAPTTPTILEMQGRLAAVNESVNLAVAHTPTKALADPTLRVEAERLVVEKSVPVTFEQATTRSFVTGDDTGWAQTMLDHGHITESGVDALTPPGTPREMLPPAAPLDIAARLTDDHLTAIKRVLDANGGFISRRLMTGALGAGFVGTAAGAENIPETPRTLLGAIGTLLLAEAAGPSVTKWPMTRRFLEALDAKPFLASPGTQDFAGSIQRMSTLHDADVGALEATWSKTFNTPAAREALPYAVEQGPASPHWHTLTPAQQAGAQQIALFTEGFGRILEQGKVIGTRLSTAMVEYFPRILKPEARLALNAKFGGLQNAIAGLATKPGFGKQRTFALRDELQRWLTKEGIPDALETDGVRTLVEHVRTGFKALDNRAMIDGMTTMGYLKPLERGPGGLPSGFLHPPDGWRPLAGFGPFHELHDQMAPNDVAALLEGMGKVGNAASGFTQKVGGVYDRVNTLATQAIMYNNYIHAINLWRARVSAGVGEAGFARAREAIRAADPVVRKWAGYGLQVGGSESANAVNEAFNDLLGHVTQGSLTSKALVTARDYFEMQHRVLFSEKVPATGVAIAETEARRWAERTGFQFGPGSPQYETNMQRIATYANNQMGRVPTLFRSRDMQSFMRRAFFAPQWLESRWNLWRQALGDTKGVVLGQIAPGDALYAHAKLRMLAYGTAATGVLSLALSGQLPEFNPKTVRLYAKTGMKDRFDKDVGVDVMGWWTDDWKMLAHPGDFVASKVAPAIRLVTTAGEAAFGHSVSGLEAAENVFQSLGGIPQAAVSVLRPLATGQLPTTGEALRDVGGATGLFRLSALPGEGAQVTAAARKLLLQAGIPPTDERLYELTRAIRSDYAISRGASWYGRAVTSYLGHESRIVGGRNPGATLGMRLRDLLPRWNQ